MLSVLGVGGWIVLVFWLVLWDGFRLMFLGGIVFLVFVWGLVCLG